MSERRLGRVAGLVSLATLLSRVLGLVREQVFAAMLGASNLADAYIAAFRLPNLLRDLLAEGALSQAFIPSFRAELTQRDPAAAYRLAARVAGNVIVVVGGLVGLAMVFAPGLVASMVGDFDTVPGKVDLTVTLTRVMLPFLLLASLTAIAMGMQQAQERYAAPALSPATFNLVAITVGVGLHASGLPGRGVVIGWALGTVVAGVAQLAVQLPGLWRLGWRPRLGLDLRLRDPAVRRVVRVLAPAILAAAAVQLNVFINTIYASEDPGAVSWLAYAFRFLQLPIGVFGVAIATVSTTRYVDAAARRDDAALARHVTDGLRLVAFLCVPAMVGLIVDAEAVIRLIYQHGRFAPRDTAATSIALDLYVLGLPADAAVKVMAPVCYAVDRTRLAVIASVVAVAGNLIANATLHLRYGYRALALGTAIAAIVNAGILYAGIHRAIVRLPGRELAAHLARVSAAALGMGACAWVTERGLDRAIGHHGLGARALDALAPVVVGAAVYALLAAWLGIAEVRPLIDRLRRRAR
ncbi:MAG: murein biosynthesis integral membrane protein MurJ [Myxococcales bacterium]|nr:murein biosynthesis integral membrane protein MurJ [Myxococcales bacterium]